MQKLFLLGLVITFGLTGCSKINSRVATRLNQDATLTGNLPVNPLQWKVITTSISQKDSSMSTIFGNDIAVQYARSAAGHNYPIGSMISLVVWSEEEDPRWFGGRIPASPKSVEIVTVKTSADHKPLYAYQTFSGSPLKQTGGNETPSPIGRTAYLLSQRAAVMP